MITRLHSGGIIACYACPAACAHCMYGSSPDAGGGYIDEKTAAYLCERVSRLGCRAMHIGGGEPFNDPVSLVKLVKTMRANRVAVDYVETNAAWVTGDDDRDADLLMRVVAAGGDVIMVSADFFHIEFIPFWKVLALIDLLERKRVSYFVWQQRYLHALSTLDPDKTYDARQLEAALGYDAVLTSAREYGMGFNGRALNLMRRMATRKAAEGFLNGKPCDNLHGTSHFHVDLYGRFLPSGCPGMGIKIDDVGSVLNEPEYPVMSRLYGGGLRALWEHAKDKGFAPDAEGYVSKCDLCFSMRKFLINTDAESHPDLAPEWYYRQDY